MARAVGWCVPAAHFWQNVAPTNAPETVPGAHSWHALTETALAPFGLAVPCGQATQRPVPKSKYWPATQASVVGAGVGRDDGAPLGWADGREEGLVLGTPDDGQADGREEGDPKGCPDGTADGSVDGHALGLVEG